MISDVIKTEGDVSNGVIKSKLPEEYSYTDIKAVMNYLTFQKN